MLTQMFGVDSFALTLLYPTLGTSVTQRTRGSARVGLRLDSDTEGLFQPKWLWFRVSVSFFCLEICLRKLQLVSASPWCKRSLHWASHLSSLKIGSVWEKVSSEASVAAAPSSWTLTHWHRWTQNRRPRSKELTEQREHTTLPSSSFWDKPATSGGRIQNNL